MNDIFLLIFLTVPGLLIIQAVRTSVTDGFFLHGLSERYRDLHNGKKTRLAKVLRVLEKPLFNCSYCMSSLYGLFTFLTLWPMHRLPVVYVLIYPVLLLGAVTIYNQIAND